MKELLYVSELAILQYERYFAEQALIRPRWFRRRRHYCDIPCNSCNRTIRAHVYAVSIKILSIIIQVVAVEPTRSLLPLKMRLEVLLAFLCLAHVYAEETTTEAATCAPTDAPTTEMPIGCVCGVFLSGQFKKGSKEQPKGNPALLHEHPDTFPCSIVGNKLCTNKCLDTIVKHLPNSPAILCGSIDRDCHKERAYLFIKNCKDEWMNTNLSAGREYCCKDGLPYKCPILS